MEFYKGYEIRIEDKGKKREHSVFRGKDRIEHGDFERGDTDEFVIKELKKWIDSKERRA